MFYLDAPQFENPNSIIYAGAEGEPLQMQCAAEGNPRPDVEWRLAPGNGNSASLPSGGILVGRGEIFAREKILENDFGTYICTARSMGFPPVSKKIILAKKCEFYKFIGPMQKKIFGFTGE